LQTEGKETEDNPEGIKSEKKVKKTKKQLQKEAQTELKRQTEELRKSQAEKSNNVEKLGNVENNEIKQQNKKTSKKKPTLSEKHHSDDEETLNENSKIDHLRHNSIHMDMDSESPDESDESSDLDTSFESINSERRENMETTMQDDQRDQNEENELAENKTNLSIKCEQCGYISRSKGGHTRHIRKCQPEKLGLEPDTSKPKFHQCEQCEYTAPKRVLVINHMRSHGIFQCKRCTFRADSEDNLEEHSALEHKDRSDCKFCKNCNRYVKCSEIPLEKHMEDCQGRIPFKCPECSKEFQYESSLKCHVVSHYPDQPKLFSCNQCNYKSNYKANLKKHIRHIHEHRGERTVKCTECDKLFYTEDNMKRHLKLHSEERPHRCEQENCGKSFKTINGLKFHVLSHQTDRPFPCDIEGCLKSFKTSRALGVHLNETHQQSPKNYKCEEDGCEMAFYKKCHLDRHMDAHKGNNYFLKIT
jgi:KRAB domain-containing zinc finger protein